MIIIAAVEGSRHLRGVESGPLVLYTMANYPREEKVNHPLAISCRA